MSDYKLTLKVQNARFEQKFKEKGIKTIMELSRESGINMISLYGLYNFKITPVSKNGNLRKSVQDLCDFLGCLPEDLFSEEQMFMSIETNKSVHTADFEEIGILFNGGISNTLESDFDRESLKKYIPNMMNVLNSRESDILSRRYGLNGFDEHTYEKIAEVYCLSNGRVQQIEQQVLRKIRRKNSAKFIKDYCQ